MLFKKNKTVVYHVLKVLATTSRDLILTKADSDINILKNSDIAIMDIASTGSNISKYNLQDVAIVALKEKIKEEVIKEEPEINVKKEEPQMTMADFIDDFKI